MKRAYLWMLVLLVSSFLGLTACASGAGGRSEGAVEQTTYEAETEEALQEFVDEEFSLEKTEGDDLENSAVYKALVETIDEHFDLSHRIVYSRDYNQVWLYIEMGADMKTALLSRKAEMKEAWEDVTSSFETMAENGRSVLKLGGYEDTAFCLGIVETFNSDNQYYIDDLLYLNVNGITGYDVMED